MEKFFNTSGPIDLNDHYGIDPLKRLDWQEIIELIESKRYFVLHAPRQTGKTSALLAMMKKINDQGRFLACYANIEAAQAARGEEKEGIPTVCSAISRSISIYLNDDKPYNWFKDVGRQTAAQDQLSSLLTHWSKNNSKPIVLFLDEVDALVGDTLISLLRQIRAGYAQRPEAFPQSIVLCGVRDVRDYRMNMGNGEVITGGSAFNIKAKSLRLGNFSYQECKSLVLQHTHETGQEFEDQIFDELWEDTAGQPWLVNALAYEMTWEDKALRNRKLNISMERYKQARERLIQSRATHLDQLSDKLHEPRVRRVISGILSGESHQSQLINLDDIQYVEDLGLITSKPSLKISNRIYQEVIPRELSWVTQVRIPNQETVWYVDRSGKLNMNKLLTAFQQFYRENFDVWLPNFDYKEAAPQILLQAFLQRILNGGGRIYREYALGRKRTDLFIEWPIDEERKFTNGVQRIVIELKILRESLEKTIEKGIEQTLAYSKHVGAVESHLVIFNRDPNISWDEKIWHKTDSNVEIWGA